jgi:histidinol-phosphate aminotransferase
MLICPPTYGMYEVSAAINNVAVKKVPLTDSFQLDLPAIENAVDDHTKMIFLCSPNNPTGNAIHREDVEAVLNNYFGIVVIDEAYINFSRFRSFSQELKDYPQLVIMQTLSKAWGLAALRVGMSFASREIIGVMNRIKPPYNINQASQELAMIALDNVESVNEMIRELVAQRKLMEEALPALPVIKKLFPSEANFILAEVSNAPAVYQYLLKAGIVVRLRKNILIFGDCLRITVGTPEENGRLIEALKNFKEQ